MKATEPYRYNYEALDKFLSSNFDPKELGNQLDELMSDLVHVSRNEEEFGNTLSNHHFTLRKLRDIFWCLPAGQAGQLPKA